MREEFKKYKIYKNETPSSIINYVGGQLQGSNTQDVNQHLFNYPRRRNSLYLKKFDSKDSIPKVTVLNTVVEKKTKYEESSSSFENSEENNIIKNNEYILKAQKSVNLNYRFKNNNINKQIQYNSTNKLFNYKSNTTINDKKYYGNTTWSTDTNLVKNFTFCDNINSYKEFSRSFKSSIDDNKSDFLLNEIIDSDIEKEEYNNNDYNNAFNSISGNENYKHFSKRKKDIKKGFYLLISIFYLSLYFLCLKISLTLSIPIIPGVGVSTFLINFNILLMSLLFMKLDQVDLLELLYFQKYGNLFLKIIFNYIHIVLTIKSLQYIKLFSFILILNMNPLIKSYIFIKENNKIYNLLDFINYLIFIFIIIIEFIINDKISTLCAITLMIINTIITFSKITSVKNIHSYIIHFGSSLIGIAISPIIMSANKDNLNLSMSQYLLFTMICFAYFLYRYFESKYSHYSIGQGYQIASSCINIGLNIIYSNFLLKENNYFHSYILLGLSFLIHIYAKLRIEEISNNEY